MRRSTLFYALLVVTAAAAVGFWQLLHNFPPRESIIAHGESVVDLGVLQVGEPIKRDIVLRNPSSTKELKIVRAYTSCECTAVHCNQNRIGPGKTATLRILTAGQRPLGERRVGVYIEWQYENSSRTLISTAMVESNTISNIEFQSNTVDFGEVDQTSKPADRTIDVWRTLTGKNWDNLNLISESKNLKTYSKLTNFNHFLIDLHFDPLGLPQGLYRSTLEAYTTIKGQRTGDKTTFFIFAEVKGSYTCIPKVIQFSALEKNEPIHFSVVVHSTKTPIVSLVSLTKDVKLKTQIERGGASAIVEGETNSPKITGPFTGHFLFQINNDSFNTIQIPFVGYVE